MIGKQVQNYLIVSHLGQGGMGTVFRATDSVLGRDVALKMLHSPMISQPKILERFKKEAQVLARLLHPNIAVIYNMIEQDQQFYMVMEYVEGKNLDELLRKHHVLTHTLVVPVFMQALEGLHHAHRKGIYHRDIKPSNLILTPDGTVKLMDFGIARVAGEERMTQANRVIGTVEYLAPELIEGKEPSVASDIYAMGMTMYELLCGKLPFDSTTDFNLMQEILKRRPTSPEKMNAAVPKPLAAIVMKALEKRPEHRFADAKAFQQALLLSYPAAKEADLTSIQLNQPLKAAAATMFVPVQTWSTKDAKPTALHKPYAFAVQPLAYITGIKEKLFQRVNQRALLAGIFIFLAMITATLVLTKKNPVLPNGPELVDVSGDLIKPEKKIDTAQKITGGTSSSEVTGKIQNVVVKPIEKHIDPVEPGIARNQEKDKKKNSDLTTGKGNEPVKNDKEKPAPVKDEIVTKEEEKEIIPTPAPPKPRQSRTFTLNKRIEVSLFLREAINPSTAQGGQSLSFSVTSPVMLDGEVIIEKGAMGTGRIKSVGNKKISVILNNVVAANGQYIPLQEMELSGRIEEMVNSRNYSAYLKKGTSISF